MELMGEGGRMAGYGGEWRVSVAMDKACTDPALGRAMERLWWKRFT